MIIIIITASSMFLLIRSTYHEFDIYSKELRSKELSNQKRLLKQRVNTTVQFMRQQMENFHGKNIEDLKNFLYLTFEI